MTTHSQVLAKHLKGSDLVGDRKRAIGGSSMQEYPVRLDPSFAALRVFLGLLFRQYRHRPRFHPHLNGLAKHVA